MIETLNYLFERGVIGKHLSYPFLKSILASNIILNFLLIPVYGISGAAVATVISYASIFLLGLFFSQKVHYIGFPLKITFASISFAVIFTLLQLSEEIPKRIEMLSESLILLFIIGLLMLSLHSLRKSLN